MSIGHLARYALALLLYYTGVLHLARRVRLRAGQPYVLILAYHSFANELPYLNLDVPPVLLAKQVDYMRRHFRMLTLAKVLAEQGRPGGLTGDIAVVTVDDGYADNFTPLLEMAHGAGVPSTLFLTTDCIDRAEPTTVLWVILAVHFARVEWIEVADLGLPPLPVRTTAEKEAAIIAIDAAIKPLSAAPRRAAIESLLGRCGSEQWVREVARSSMLTWQQVRVLQAAGVEIGAHSLTHPCLSNVPSAEAHREIAESVERVRQVTGQQDVPFAYPYGSEEDVGDSARQHCLASGASAGVMLCDGAMPGDDRFAIPRRLVHADQATNPWGGFSKAVWACELEGLFDHVRRAVSGPRGWLRARRAGWTSRLQGARRPSATGDARIVTYLVDNYSNQGGSETQLLQLLSHMDRSRYAPRLVALRTSHCLRDQPPPCPVEVLDIPRLSSVRALLRMTGLALRLRRAGCRLVHCYYNDTSMIAPPIMWLFGIRTIVSRRDMGFWQTARTKAVTRRVAPFVSQYVVNSLAVQRCIQEIEHAPANRISVIYNGYVKDGDCASGVPGITGIPDGSRVVGIVANVKPVKRLDTLIDAFAQFARRLPDTVVVIVGNDSATDAGGSLMEELRARARRHGIDHRVIFTGGVDRPSAYIRRFDVAVLCSESEGLSNSVMECMAESRAMVCTDAGGNPELVQHGATGYLVPVGDSDALAARIEELLADADLRRRMGEAGRAMIQLNFSHRKMVAEHVALYDELLAPVQASRARLAAP